MTIIASHPIPSLTDDAPPTSRLDHLLAIGRREFLAHGYQRTSVEGIGKAAGVSKQTIYRHFSDKSEILGAIVQQLSAIFKDTAASLPLAHSPLEAIAAAAAPVRHSFLDGEAIGLFRLGISLAGQFQDLSATVNRQFVASLAPIAERMAALAERGVIVIDDPLSAAAQLGGMVVEGVHYLMGHALPPAESFDLYTHAIADLYLKGFLGRTLALPSLESGPAPDAAAAALHIAARSYFPDAAEFRLAETDLQRLLAVSRRKFFRAGYS